jgi:DNA-binding transcriptional LysR family regulator
MHLDLGHGVDAQGEVAAVVALVEVLRGYACDESGLFLYYPQRATQAAKLRAIIDTAKDVLRL